MRERCYRPVGLNAGDRPLLPLPALRRGGQARAVGGAGAGLGEGGLGVGGGGKGQSSHGSAVAPDKVYTIYPVHAIPYF